MPITIVCGRCGKKAVVADSTAGAKGKCRKCGGTIVVPASSPPTHVNAAANRQDEHQADEQRSKPSERLLIASGTAAGIALVAVLVYLLFLKDRWENGNREHMIALRDEARRLVARNALKDGYAKYAELDSLIGQHQIRDDELRRQMAEAHVAYQHVGKDLAEQSRLEALAKAQADEKKKAAEDQLKQQQARIEVQRAAELAGQRRQAVEAQQQKTRQALETAQEKARQAQVTIDYLNAIEPLVQDLEVSRKRLEDRDITLEGLRTLSEAIADKLARAPHVPDVEWLKALAASIEKDKARCHLIVSAWSDYIFNSGPRGDVFVYKEASKVRREEIAEHLHAVTETVALFDRLRATAKNDLDNAKKLQLSASQANTQLPLTGDAAATISAPAIAAAETAPANLAGEIRIVIWNTHNYTYGERGTDQCNVRLFNGDQEFWSQKDVSIPWRASGPASTEVRAQVERFDRLRIEITKCHGRSAGLAEIEVFVGGKNIARGRAVTTDGHYDHGGITPASLTDGVTEDSGNGKGYWLHDKPVGWIELHF